MWEGIDREGIRVIIDRSVWARHVLKHPEIEPFLEAVARTIVDPESIFPDTRPDEAHRYFRRLYRSDLLSGYFAQHDVRVAVKYVRQSDDSVIGFYSSSWFQREIVEPHSELERIHPDHVD